MLVHTYIQTKWTRLIRPHEKHQHMDRSLRLRCAKTMNKYNQYVTNLINVCIYIYIFFFLLIPMNNWTGSMKARSLAMQRPAAETPVKHLAFFFQRKEFKHAEAPAVNSGATSCPLFFFDRREISHADAYKNRQECFPRAHFLPVRFLSWNLAIFWPPGTLQTLLSHARNIDFQFFFYP